MPENTKTPVLVTGATGYVAGVLIARLLEEDHVPMIHATVRNIKDSSRYQHLLDLKDAKKRLKLFQADLLDSTSFDEAMKGCGVVFHTASPVVLNAATEDPQREIVDPAKQGTANLLECANRTPSVRTVVLTSSIGAMYSDNAETLAVQRKDGLHESSWNTTASLDYQPYFFSKTEAERLAWVMAGSQTQWVLKVVNPGMVMGPGVVWSDRSETCTFFKQMFDGTMAAGAPDFYFPLVDVRDVAEAHVRVAFGNEEGRHLLVGHVESMIELAALAAQDFPSMSHRMPKMRLPKFLLWLIAPWLPKDQRLKRQTITGNYGIPPTIDSSKGRGLMTMAYRGNLRSSPFIPLRDSVRDMIQQMLDAKVISNAKG